MSSLKYDPLAGQGGGAHLQKFKAHADWGELGWRLLGWREKGGDGDSRKDAEGKKGMGVSGETLGPWEERAF